VNKSARIGIRVAPEIREKLQRLADNQRRSLSSMAEILLEDALESVTVIRPDQVATIVMPEHAAKAKKG